MNNSLNNAEDYLREKGVYVATTSGVSMFPLLRDRKYAVKIEAVKGRLKKYDVALFRRGDQLVLHRVIKVYPDRYFIRGDNREKGDIVFDRQILGILTQIVGKDKTVNITDRSYIVYSRLTVWLFPLRCVLKIIRRVALRIARFFKGKRQ